MGELGLLWNFKQDLEDMKDALEMLQAVLRDAEKRSMREEAVRLWLRRLKSLAYDIEDMLNDFHARIPAPNMAGVRDDAIMKVRQFFSSNNQLISHEFMAHKMKRMKEKLNKIAADKDRYKFSDEKDDDKQKVIKERETFRAVSEDEVIGRKEEKEEILTKLLAENGGRDDSIISIVGIGGLGKTTFVQYILKDERLLSNFDSVIWVHAMDFDLMKLGRSIVSSATREVCSIDNLDLLHQRIQDLLARKKYLAVMDDLWIEDEEKWMKLLLLLGDANRGSRIVVTTRSLQVASAIRTETTLLLKNLSYDECWKLFQRRAFKSVVDRSPSLLEIGQEIVRKCGGIPLAVVALGEIVSHAMGEVGWRNVRDSEIWELEQDHSSDASENKIMASLNLSYQHMTSSLKLCFAYCSMYPRGYELDKDKLIQQWIALSFIESKDLELSLEEGETYINQLQSLSFFVDRRENPKTGKGVTYKIHDLAYDVACFAAGNQILTIEDGKNITNDHKECRYASVIGYDNPSELSKVLPQKVRSLNFRRCVPKNIPHHMFSWTKYVRILSLSGCFIDKLPESLYGLNQLRYLDISHLPIKNLSSSIQNLSNLQTLEMRDSIGALPDSISNLQKLYSLNLSSCLNLSTLPSSFGKCQNLLRLDLSGCDKLLTLPDFQNMGKLKHLDLSGCSSLQELPESIGALLQLKHLDLSECRNLRELPESIGALRQLKHLDLSECRKLRELPESMGELLKLQKLLLGGCRLKVLPESLSRLTKLEISNLRICEEFQHLPEDLDICFETVEDLDNTTNLGNMANLDNRDFSVQATMDPDETKFFHITPVENMNFSVRRDLSQWAYQKLSSLEDEYE